MLSPDSLEVLITQDEISRVVKRLSQEISRDYRDKHPLLLGILKGSFIFLADLVRLLEIPVEIDFIRLSSYGSSKVSSGKVRVVHGLNSKVRGKDVIVIDDIVDTGLATRFVIDYLSRRKPASVKVCALLDKPSRRQTSVPIEYLGVKIPDRFVVGYGLDYDERFRELPDIRVVED